MDNPKIAWQHVSMSLRSLGKMAWENWASLILLLLAPFLIFYNLGLNPRPWHDEGTYLTLAKTLKEDGVYALRTSAGYSTFGAVQSLGPTVIVPLALYFRAFGAGLVNGRVVAGIFLFISLLLFHSLSRTLFGSKSALFSMILLLSSPLVGFLLYGRPMLGIAPAFAFFLAFWMVWSAALRSKWTWLHVPAGFLLGFAIVTKSQYLLIGFGSIGIMFLLDRFHYRLGAWKGLLIVGVASSLCVAAWYGWQVSYYGVPLFMQNAQKLSALGKATMGFNLRSAVEAIRYLFGTGSGFTYQFWAIPALIYVGIKSSQRTTSGISLGFLVVFTALWLVYFVFLSIPWAHFLFPAAALLAVFVGNLFSDLLAGFLSSSKDLWRETRGVFRGNSTLTTHGMASLGTLVALLSLALLSAYQLQKAIRDDVLDKNGNLVLAIPSPPEFSRPQEMAEYLQSSIPRDAVIDTWESELGILTDHNYHYPDSSLLAISHQTVFREDADLPSSAILGADYFESIKPDYVVVGWYAKQIRLYDLNYLWEHARLIQTIGDGFSGYEVYKMDEP